MPDDARDTRDMAVRAETKVDSHLIDCANFRRDVAKSFKEIRDDLKRQNWLIAFIIGGITLLGKIFDYIPNLVHTVLTP